MWKKDFHVHTSFSSDSEASPQSMIESAITKGLKEICITDHYDFYYPHGHDFTLDVPRYIETIRQLAEVYREQIIVHCGVEIGMDLMYKDEIHELLKTYDFDFVIGSVHVIEQTEFYYGDYFKGKTKAQAHRYYLEVILACIKEFPEINVVGHLDYIIRYGKEYYSDFNQFDYEENQDVLETIFRELIQSNRGIEINTSGYRYGMNCTHPNKQLVDMYRQLGGTYITVGSDAHKPEQIAIGFENTF